MVDKRTWGEGEYGQEEVIESADHTGYLSPSEYVSGDNGLEPDPVGDDGDGDWF